jgi:uracil-DNA glycosylase
MKQKIDEYYKEALGVEWYQELKPILYSSMMNNIRAYIINKRGSKGAEIYPRQEEVFSAFKCTSYSDTKIVILGQDCYHTPGHAHGLAFSSKHRVCPPSLRNILKEVDNDIYPKTYQSRNTWRLDTWANQGVLLLNTALTVEKGNPGSHIGIWQPFTKSVIEVLNKRKGLIYMLWGGYAKQFKTCIDVSNNYVLEAAHPSPLSANKGFFGCKHFSKANELLSEKYGKEFTIKW